MEEARDRFFSKVNKTDSCWLWTAPCDRNGYGRFNITSKQKIMAHRGSWLLAGNTIPEGLILRHKCRNRNCVNPEHLETGTHQENCADMIRDGTIMRGKKHHSVKLTEEQVLQIRARSTETQKILAEEFGVSRETISKIILNKIWTWLLPQAGNDLV